MSLFHASTISVPNWAGRDRVDTWGKISSLEICKQGIAYCKVPLRQTDAHYRLDFVIEGNHQSNLCVAAV